MIRKLLTVVLPILLPFLVYAGYLYLARRRAMAGRGPPGWSDAPWSWLFLSAAVLLAAALLVLRFTTDMDPGAEYVPPRLIDGEIVPGHSAE